MKKFHVWRDLYSSLLEFKKKVLKPIKFKISIVKFCQKKLGMDPDPD
jgi:hypothetical protein